MMIVGQVSSPEEVKWNSSPNPLLSQTAHASLPYDSERCKTMEKKTKNKKNIPNDIPIVWVNIVDGE
jgi:hypothetical protein